MIDQYAYQIQFQSLINKLIQLKTMKQMESGLFDPSSKKRHDQKLHHSANISDNLKQKIIDKQREIDIRKGTIIQKTAHKARVYTTQIYNHRLCRRFIIDLPPITNKTDSQKNNNIGDEQFKANEEYFLQEGIFSQFVLKNVTKKTYQSKIVIFQEDFDCLLAQFPLKILNFQKRVKIFICIARGMKDLHNHMVCHRSLNPFHICIKKTNKTDYVAKINYFQNAVKLQSMKSTLNDNIQTNSYSAPEIRHRRSYNLFSDVYSLGAIFNYILYGTLQNVWEQNEQTKIEVPDKTPEWLLQLLKSMMHQNPKKRYEIGTVIEMLNASLKCAHILNRVVPLGHGDLKFTNIQTKLRMQQQI